MTFPQIVGGFDFDDEVKQKIWWQYKVPEWFFLSPLIIIWLLFILQFSILSLFLRLSVSLSLSLSTPYVLWIANLLFQSQDSAAVIKNVIACIKFYEIVHFL